MENKKNESKGELKIYIETLVMIVGLIAVATIFIVQGTLNKSKAAVPAPAKVEEKIEGEKLTNFLLAEITETVSSLKLVGLSAKGYKEIASKKFLTENYPGMEAMLKDFLKPFEKKENYPNIALIGVTGIIKDNVMFKMATFKKWEKTDGNKLQKSLNINKVKLVNINAFNGYGIKTDLKEGKDYIVLNGKKPNGRYNKIVIEPTFSIGVSLLQVCRAQNGNYRVIESDAGYQDLNPLTKEIKGDYAIFAYKLDKEKGEEDAGINIVENLGEFASNLALTYLPFGGIYITGELPRKIKNSFKIERFNKKFLEKLDYKEVLEEIPIVLVLNENIKTIGAIEYAREMLA